MKNTPSRHVRNRTFEPIRPETRDRRVRKTKRALHDALMGLAREKPYPAIAVKEILHRANVGRSTFYSHFRDNDDLLESSIHDLLSAMYHRTRSDKSAESIVSFSLPILQHIDAHRRGGPMMPRKGRLAMHQRLRTVLADVIVEDLATAA